MAIQIYRLIKTLSTSDLKHLVAIQTPRRDVADAAMGHGPGLWQDFDQRWAYIASWAQTESYRAHQKLNSITQLMVVRFDPAKAIVEDMRIILDPGHPFGAVEGSVQNRWWKVTSVENYEERNIWIIVAGNEEKEPGADY